MSTAPRPSVSKTCKIQHFDDIPYRLLVLTVSERLPSVDYRCFTSQGSVADFKVDPDYPWLMVGFDPSAFYGILICPIRKIV